MYLFPLVTDFPQVKVVPTHVDRNRGLASSTYFEPSGSSSAKNCVQISGSIQSDTIDNNFNSERVWKLNEQLEAAHKSQFLSDSAFAVLLEYVNFLVKLFPLSPKVGYVVDAEEADDDNNVQPRGVIQILDQGDSSRPMCIFVHVYENASTLYIRDAGLSRSIDGIRSVSELEEALLPHVRSQRSFVIENYAG